MQWCFVNFVFHLTYHIKQVNFLFLLQAFRFEFEKLLFLKLIFLKSFIFSISSSSITSIVVSLLYSDNNSLTFTIISRIYSPIYDTILICHFYVE